jgi:hypothetical protein
MSWIAQLLVLALVVGGVWVALSPKFVFRIQVVKGTVRVTKGKLTPDFQQQVGEILDQWRISRGWIGGVQRGRRVTLVFSHSVPSGCRQQLRNLWVNC